MAFTFRYLILACSLWVALAPVGTTAQTAGGGVREFTVLAGGDADWTGVSYQRSATEAVALTFANQRRSDLHTATGEIVLFTRERIDPVTQKPARVVVARAPWPAGVRTALLVFVPRTAAGADGIEFDVLAVDDGAEAFPAETFRVLNLTPVTLLARIGEREAEIKPGVSPVVRLSDVAAGGATAVPLALGVRTEKGPLALYLGPIEVKPGRRVLALVTPPKTSGARKVRVNLIGQTVSATPMK
jgi:hypothetical protein